MPRNIYHNLFQTTLHELRSIFLYEDLKAGIKQGDIEGVSTLLTKPFVLIRARGEEWQLLSLAVKSGNLEILDALLEIPQILAWVAGNPNGDPKIFNTPLEVAAANGQLPALEKLLQYPEVASKSSLNSECSALRFAVQYNQDQIAARLMQEHTVQAWLKDNHNFFIEIVRKKLKFSIDTVLSIHENVFTRDNLLEIFELISKDMELSSFAYKIIQILWPEGIKSIPKAYIDTVHTLMNKVAKDIWNVGGIARFMSSQLPQELCDKIAEYTYDYNEKPTLNFIYAPVYMQLRAFPDSFIIEDAHIIAKKMKKVAANNTDKNRNKI